MRHAQSENRFLKREAEDLYSQALLRPFPSLCTGYPLAGCSPAEPASVSPGTHRFTQPAVPVNSNSRSAHAFQNSILAQREVREIRKSQYYDEETQKTFVFLTNNFLLPALIIAQLYKARWRVELFFKWIKRARNSNQDVSEIGVNPPIAHRVRIGERITRHTAADTHMIKL